MTLAGMMLDVNVHDAISLLGAVAVVATLKADVRWIKQWCRDHARQDGDSFKDVRNQLAELRGARNHNFPPPL